MGNRNYGNEKSLYVMKTNTCNAMNNNLTMNQHRALAILSTYRHKIHVNMGSLYCSSSEEGRRYLDFMAKQMPIMLRQTGLPNLDLSLELSLLVRDCEEERFNRTALPTDRYFQKMARILAEEINTKIENYLLEIDLQYGTSYSPSRVARLKKSA